MAALILNPSKLLDAWDACAGRSASERALLLLEGGGAAPLDGDPADLSIGSRNAALLELREAMFGRLVQAVGECPRCAAPLELTFATASLRPATAAVKGPLRVEAEGYEVGCRTPTSRDLISVMDLEDIGDVSAALVARCLLSAKHGLEDVEPSSLPEAVVERIAATLTEADPQAKVDLALSCEDCGHAWSLPFDIAGFLWSEFDAWARRTLREVHDLARAYGWTEGETLALSPQRRQTYLQLVYDA